MARIRSIKPEFFVHPVLGRLAASVRLLALGCISASDDEGFFRADPAILRGSVDPFRESLADLQADLDSLCRVEFIEVRDCPPQGPVGRIVNWAKHQKVDHPAPSKLSGYFLANPSREVREGIANDSRLIKDQGPRSGREGIKEPLRGEGAKVKKRPLWQEAFSPEVVGLTEELLSLWPSRAAGDLQPDGTTAVPHASRADLARRLADAIAQGADPAVLRRVAQIAVYGWKEEGKWIKGIQHHFGPGGPWEAAYQVCITPRPSPKTEPATP